MQELWNMNQSGGETLTNGTMTADEEFYIRIITKFMVPIMFSIIVFTGSIGNILVIYVVYRNPQMMNTTNLLILNLAVADLLFILVCVPATASDYIFPWPFGLTWCRMVQYGIYVTAYVSIYTLVLMAADRFLAVVYPVSSLSYRTVPVTKLAILLTWTVLLGSGTPIWVAHHTTEIRNEIVCVFDAKHYSFKGFHLSFFVTSFAVPMVLIVLMYLVMLLHLWKTSSCPVSREGMKAKKRVTKLVLAVILVFTVCWSPIQLVLIYKALVPSVWEGDYKKILIQTVSHVFAYTNSCLNPILYAKMSRNFRAGFAQVLPLRFFRQQMTTVKFEITTIPKKEEANLENIPTTLNVKGPKELCEATPISKEDERKSTTRESYV